MEPAQAKPVRRRRRWLIVAIVLVFVFAVSWWYWPRGDARFVGKWHAGEVGVGPVVTFYANGTAISVHPPIRKLVSWRVEGDKLVWGSNRPAWIQRGLATIAPWTRRVIGYSLDYKQEDWSQILEASESAIRIKGLPPHETKPYTLLRIPE